MSPLNPLQILVIEDDADTRANLCDILELDGHVVETADSIAAALRRPDWSGVSAIILDRQLPDGSAIDCLPELNRRAPQAPVIVVTAHPDIEGAIETLREGAYDYLLKPINAGALRAGIKRIVEQRLAERRLAESEARNQALLNAIPDTILRIGQDGVLLDVRTHAGDPSCRLGMAIGGEIRASLLPAEVVERFQAIIERALAKQTPQSFKFVMPTSGGPRHYEVRVVKSGLGEVVALVRDVSEHQRSEERLLQAERLAAIGQTVAGLAHESRNAFQRSQACLEMLAMEVEDRPEALELVGRIQKAQNHLHHLYEEVRSYAAPLHLHREPCDLAQVWRDTWAHLELARQQKPLHIRERRICSDATCQGDPHALEQLFRNILENAIVACAEPGEIVVTFRDARLEQQPAIQTSIRDNGPGIPADVLPKVFDPFFTTKVKGTGLGMAIARRIVEAHGGQIAVGDNVGEGAEIVFTLPRSPLPAS